MNGTLLIEKRYNGPPKSANGGFACGRFAARAAGRSGAADHTVTLHAPPPLDTPFQVTEAGRRVHIWDRDRLIASVSPARPRIDTLPPVPAAVAARAEGDYVGAGRHPFPSCFVCGPRRDEGDGLGLRPGRLPRRPGETGCRWVPDESLGAAAGEPVPVEFAWAALDCPGGWTADLTERPMVLGRFSVDLTGVPVVAERYVIVGRADSRDERTLTSTTALYSEAGALLGRAFAVWLSIGHDDAMS